MALSKKQMAIVEELDKQCEMVREFMNDWLLFNQILSAYPSPGVNKAQLENQFLKIKSKLARENKVLKEKLGQDYSFDGNTMNIVSGATNLETIYSQSEVAVKKLQNEWHRAFIAINETIGGLEDKKARAERGEKIFVGSIMGTMKQTGGGGAGLSKNTKTFLILAAIILILAALIYFAPFAQPWRAALGIQGYQF
jgi:hypothetical protein